MTALSIVNEFGFDPAGHGQQLVVLAEVADQLHPNGQTQLAGIARQSDRGHAQKRPHTAEQRVTRGVQASGGCAHGTGRQQDVPIGFPGLKLMPGGGCQLLCRQVPSPADFQAIFQQAQQLRTELVGKSVMLKAQTLGRFIGHDQFVGVGQLGEVAG